jgi:hypothetical protein
MITPFANLQEDAENTFGSVEEASMAAGSSAKECQRLELWFIR